MSVKESSEYDNYMEEDARKNDSYSVGLDKFFDEPLPVVLQDMTKAKKVVESDVWKSIYVHFKTQADMVEFCTKINQMIPSKMRSTYHPLSDVNYCLFADDDIAVAIDPSKLVPKRKEGKRASLTGRAEAVGLRDTPRDRVPRVEGACSGQVIRVGVAGRLGP